MFPCGFGAKNHRTRVKDRAENGVDKRAGSGWGRKEGIKRAFPYFLFPSPVFHFLALISFFARPKPEIPFLGFSLLQNQTETLAMQSKIQLKGVKKGRDQLWLSILARCPSYRDDSINTELTGHKKEKKFRELMK